MGYMSLFKYRLPSPHSSYGAISLGLLSITTHRVSIQRWSKELSLHVILQLLFNKRSNQKPVKASLEFLNLPLDELDTAYDYCDN